MAFNDQTRVQAPDIAGPEPLRPPGLPGDTFTGAPRPIQDDNLARIADALGSFNTNLQRFGRSEALVNRKQQRDTEQAILEQSIAGMTREQWAQSYEQGKIYNFQDPFVKTAAEKFWGQSQAQDDINQLEQQRRTGALPLVGPDPVHPAPNIEDAITAAARQKLSGDTFRASKGAASGYAQTMTAYRDRMMKAQLDARAAQQTDYNNGIVTSNFDKVFNAGLPVDATVAGIRQVYKELGPTLLTKPGQMDTLLMNVIKNRASDPDQAERALAVLKSDREDIASGAKLPPLAANPRFAAQSQEIWNAASQALQTKFKTDTERLADKNATDAFERADGSFNALTNTVVQNPIPKHPGDTTPDTFTVSAEQAKKNAVNTYLTQSAQKAANDRETPDATFEREWKTFTTNNVDHPVWKDQLTSAAHGLLNTAALTNPDQRQQAIQAGELFMKGAERNYPYMKGLIGKDKTALDAWTVYQTVRNELGYSPDRAIDMAGAAIRTPANEQDEHVRAEQAKAITQQVKNLDWGTSWKNYFPFVNDYASNVSELQKRVGEVASVMVRVPGVSQDDAVKYAMQAVSQRSASINGWVVPETGPTPLATQKPYIEKLLGTAFQQHGKEWGTSDASQLTVQPTGGGNYAIIDKSDGFGHPVMVPSQGGKLAPAVITPAMIDKLQKTDATVSQVQNTVNSANKRDAAIIYTPNEYLSPEAQARKTELLKELNGQRAEALHRAARAVGAQDPGVSDEQVKLLSDGIKHATGRAIDSLKWLGGAIANHAKRTSDTINQIGGLDGP